MSGSTILSEKEKWEMRDDGGSTGRRQAFASARIAGQRGDLDAYIEFLSETRSLIELHPTTRVTKHNKL
jgi:hypothetical protein